MKLEHWSLIAGFALLASIAGSRLAVRLGVPVLLLFLALGMLAGSDGPGRIWYTDAALTQNLGVAALSFILFSGGMDLDWPRAQAHVGKAVSLATVGVLVTSAVVGLAAWSWLGYTFWEGMLLGAIVSSTDAAAVFSTLRRGGLSLRSDISYTLEMESGSNDPAAVFLTLALIAVVLGQSPGAAQTVLFFFIQMGLGGVGGWLAGRLGVVMMRRLRLDFDGMYHGLSTAVVLVAYGASALVGGNGFLAVYVAGVVFGQGEFRQKKGLRRFHDGIAWLMQIMLFIVLGLLVFPSQLPSVALTGLAVAAILMLAARPIGVAASLLPLRVPLREQAFISWCGLRGAVPIVLATFPLLAGVPRAQEFFNVVFFVVIMSALLQGPAIPHLIKKLGLTEPAPASPA